MTNQKHLWVDDRRVPLQPFDIATTYTRAIELIEAGDYTDVHLDHDLADFDETGREWTGYDVVKYLCQRKYDGKSVPVRYYILTSNPAGRANMVQLIECHLAGTIMKGNYEYTIQDLPTEGESEESAN